MRSISLILFSVSLGLTALLQPESGFSQDAEFLESNSQRIAAPSSSNSKLSELLRAQLPLKKADAIAVMVYDTSTGEEVFAFNSERSLKPASVLKVLSSLAALELLGPNFRFSTKVFSEAQKGTEPPRLYVQGVGDPGLTVETAWAMARGIRRRGLSRVGGLYLDSSLFEGQQRSSGQRAYQTGSSALAFNYNAFSFEVCPSLPGRPASVVLDPLEIRMPLLGSITTKSGRSGQFSIDQASSRGQSEEKLTYKLAGSIGALQGCSTVYRSMEEPERVFGRTFLGMLRAVGVEVPDQFYERPSPRGADPFYVQDSAPLSQIVRDLNNFSSNFIAEQILFALGLTEEGTFSRERGLERLRKFLRSMGFRDEDFSIQDASGLSHQNRLTARIVMALLRRGLENQSVAPEFEGSLAVAQRSGTLRRRPLDPSGVVVRGKTGTLNGVSSIAGYVVGKSGRKFAFVILQNEIASVERAHRMEDEIVAILSRS